MLYSYPIFWQELEGMVTVPGNDKDVQIADIPIVTAITTDSQDIYVKPISPMQVLEASLNFS